jgi:L-malate glycosyltransferase
VTDVGRRRIVYVNHTGRISGAEKVLLHMLHGLDLAIYEPFVLCPAEGDLPRMLTADRVPCATIPKLQARFTLRPDRILRYLLSFWRMISALRSEIKRLNPDFVHANTVRAGIAATIATAGTRRMIIWHVHDVLPRHALSGVIRLLAYSLRRTQLIAVSHAAAREFTGPLPFGARMRVIHNGTDLNAFPLKQPGDSPLKRELGLGTDSFLVCAVGQVCARKGLRELLDAFSAIHADAPHIHLAIVGRPLFKHDERYLQELLKQVDTLAIRDSVSFTGARRDIAAVLQSADLLVLNSLEEPFGLVLVEAMSCGTPVIAARVGGIPEIVTGSVDGWLIEKDDAQALGSKLLELSRQPDLLKQVARLAHDTVCPRFSLERFVARLHALYAELSVHLDTQVDTTHIPVAPAQNRQGDQFV